ncbi:hypothetical protein CR194_19365 [Salipaludibacillus keqinensis]|jgi:uncharacterized protein YybS (DUF2232 family)|uniref:DUF2232 domain-containing protein n=1 Tax=Salipaludibacillus keqinensis TaxID=2045207 RepID=A0A323TD34_9BACI|nr:YybS family protein [Salipaludibacillus keqinensis]PYZ91777.1 hypothetical protein CR194_19365 [Salipaludibacillus keqinensis]
MEQSPLIKDGAIHLGIYILLMIMTLWLPVAGLISLFFLAIPFIFFTKKHGLKAGITLATLSFFLLFIIIGPIALPLSFTFAASGVVIGEGYRRNREAFAVLLGGSLSFITAFILIYVGSILILDVNPIEGFQDVMMESTEMTEDLLVVMGDEQGEALEMAHEFIDGLVVIAPTLMIIVGVIFAFIVQIIAGALLRKKHRDVNRFPPLREWSFPKAFIWYYLLTYLFILIGVDEGTALHTVVANLRPILDVVMVIQGLALMFFYFHFKRWSIVIPVILVVISFLFPIFLHILRILGIIDLGFDLRKRMNAQK